MDLLLAVSLLLPGPQVDSGREQELRKALAGCAALAVEATRLDCFEQLANAVAQLPPEAPAPAPVRSKFPGSAEPGKWKVEVSTSLLDDSKTVALGLVDSTDSMQLVLLCQQGKPAVYVAAPTRLGVDLKDSTFVQTRFGTAKAEGKRWPVTTNHKAAMFPGDANQLIGRLLTTERLVVQVNPFDATPITAVFSLGGLPDVVGPLKAECRLP